MLACRTRLIVVRYYRLCDQCGSLFIVSRNRMETASPARNLAQVDRVSQHLALRNQRFEMNSAIALRLRADDPPAFAAQIAHHIAE